MEPQAASEDGKGEENLFSYIDLPGSVKTGARYSSLMIKRLFIIVQCSEIQSIRIIKNGTLLKRRVPSILENHGG